LDQLDAYAFCRQQIAKLLALRRHAAGWRRERADDADAQTFPGIGKHWTFSGALEGQFGHHAYPTRIRAGAASKRGR
jgi:hypothetical protein